MTRPPETAERWISPCGRMEMRLGRWQDVLADVTECDAVITDGPYSERTHSGHDAAIEMVNGGSWARSNGGRDRRRPRREISYTHWGRDDIDAFLEAFNERNGGWFVCFSDSCLTEDWRAAYEARGLTGFHPLPCVIPGMSVRLCGDGPSSWAVYANVARPKALSKWGTLRGAYSGGQGEREHIGGKPLWLMRALIGDYSRSGALILDPMAGKGTTLLAAAIEGRRCIGAECDPKTFTLAVKRLSKGYTPAMVFDRKPKPKQEALL